MPEAADANRPDTDPGERLQEKLPGFDARTNFSILGWILDRFKKGTGNEQQIDLTLD